METVNFTSASSKIIAGPPICKHKYTVRDGIVYCEFCGNVTSRNWSPDTDWTNPYKLPYQPYRPYFPEYPYSPVVWSYYG